MNVLKTCTAYWGHRFQEVKCGLNLLFFLRHGGQLRTGCIITVVHILQNFKRWLRLHNKGVACPHPIPAVPFHHMGERWFKICTPSKHTCLRGNVWLKYP